MTETANDKRYDLPDRTLESAKRVRAFVKRLPRNITNVEDVKQPARSSGSVGANYIEADGSLGKKDFQMRVKIAKKEAKETAYWLKLLDTGDESSLDAERARLVEEAQELTSILGAILRNSG